MLGMLSWKHAIPAGQSYPLQPPAFIHDVPWPLVFPQMFSKPYIHQSNIFQAQLCWAITGSQAFEVEGQLIRVVRAVWVTITLPLGAEQASAISTAELIWPTWAVHCGKSDDCQHTDTLCYHMEILKRQLTQKWKFSQHSFQVWFIFQWRYLVECQSCSFYN